jgi:LemA protein
MLPPAVVTAIADARTRYSGASTPEEKAQAASQVEGALGRLLVITENYPVLKSSETMQTLMAQLEGTENRISVERGRYNQEVSNYNLMTLTFPKNLIAKVFGFKAKTLFKADEGAKTAPKVNF